MDNINNFKLAIEKAETILVVSHVNPDGDTLSANLALVHSIKKHFNKKAIPVYVGNIPAVYKFLPGIEKFVNVSNIDRKEIYDLVIAVDIAAKDRMVDALELFTKAKCNVNIDHHKTNNNYGKLNYVDVDACSAGEVVFNILAEINAEISKDIATCIYTSILTDTGCFKYEKTTSKTFDIASKLVGYGASPSEIARECYDTKPQNMVQFQVNALNNAKFLEDGKIAYTIVTLDDMKKFNASNEHTDGISEALRQIKTVEVAILLKETENNQTKVSLRSKNIDVSKIASNFNGGGHTFAAGCTIKKPPSVAINKLLEYIMSEMK